MRVKQTILIIFLFTTIGSFAQAPEDRTEWIPLFENRLPSRFFTFKTNYNFQYSINSKSDIEQIGNGSAEVSGNRNASLDLKFPILNKTNVILSGSIKYSDEQFYFEKHNPATYPLYVSLNDRNLKNLGGDINGLFHHKNNKSFLLRSSIYLAGDFYRSDDSFSTGKLLKFSLALGYGIKKDVNTFYAYGIYAGYTFGRPSIYPALVYSKRMNHNIGLDATLPQSVKIWKKFSDNTFIYARSAVSGNSYTVRLQGSVLKEFDSLQLRQSNLNSSVGIMQKLGKWIWLEGNLGYTHYFSFNISESNFKHNYTIPRPNSTYLIESDVSGSPFASISLFLAPPKELLNKFLR